MQERWFLLGDIHAEPAPVGYFYLCHKDRLHLNEGTNYMILLGDVGANYYGNRKDELCKRILANYPFTYICLRGNHESRVTDVVKNDPSKWERVQKYGGWIYREKAFPNIEYLEDIPAVYEFNGFRTLAIPGAYSVDKEYRLYNNWQWYENEQLSKEEMEECRRLIQNEKNVDLVISHTCPLAFEPRDLFISGIDQSKVDKSMELFLDEIEQSVAYKRWAWGHFHKDRLYPWDGEKEKLMLFHEQVVDLTKFMNMKKTDYLQDILA